MRLLKMEFHQVKEVKKNRLRLNKQCHKIQAQSKLRARSLSLKERKIAS
jgi:hypothetical protein